MLRHLFHGEALWRLLHRGNLHVFEATRVCLCGSPAVTVDTEPDGGTLGMMILQLRPALELRIVGVGGCRRVEALWLTEDGRGLREAEVGLACRKCST